MLEKAEKETQHTCCPRWTSGKVATPLWGRAPSQGPQESPLPERSLSVRLRRAALGLLQRLPLSLASLKSAQELLPHHCFYILLLRSGVLGSLIIRIKLLSQ
ncbi:unnamed protein product [Rangifer tarandus platyrhynchus]|uniref:Uncharacterized protein n=2 Tax=Rangifer tarandus platyrhynchus TaxID=3082113 RepID=A0ACB0EZK3_RANTA|nr:unnamed protein product [Rangifer tarandus platyrhynchus]CAI9706009.1 unnamed protein product [Rangifer tarandus platyrhynchus]